MDPDEGLVVGQLPTRVLPRLSAATPLYDMLKLFEAGGSHIALLTRPAALALAGLWFLFAIGAPANGKQHWLMLGAFDHYPAMLFLLSIAFLMRGGGRYSLDRRIGREF